MLSIFSCACWSSVCFWRNVHLGPLLVFWFGCFILILSYISCCMLWKLSPCWLYNFQIFSPNYRLSLHFVYGFPLLCKILWFWLGPICYIFAFISFALENDVRKYCYNMSKNILLIFPSRSFMVSCLIFKALGHFEFIFVYVVRECPLICLWLSNYSSTICRRDCILVHCIFLPLLSKINWLWECGVISGLSFLFP